MRVRIGTVEIEEPYLTRVVDRGLEHRGFEFAAIIPEVTGKRITDALNAMKGEGNLPCEAETNDGERILAYGKLEHFESQRAEGATSMCMISGVVSFLH